MTPKLTGDKCRCTACGLYFNSTSVFDLHRRGPYTGRRCLTVDEMQAKGYSVNAKGFWIRRKRSPETGTATPGAAITYPAVQGAGDVVQGAHTA